MTTIDKIIDIIEENEISIHNYTEDNKLCGYELSTYTKGGVNEVIFLDFRDNKDPNNPKHFVEKFEEYIENYLIDEQIDIYRQDAKYVNDFSISDSLEDFKSFKKNLQSILQDINGETKIYSSNQFNKIKETHEELRNILIEYGSKEYGDCIVDKISELFNYPTTLSYYREE